MLYSENVDFLEEIVRSYLRDPASIDPSWRLWLEGEGREYLDAVPAESRPNVRLPGLFAPKGVAAEGGGDAAYATKQAAVNQWVRAYRRLGHLGADLDPLGLEKAPGHAELALSYWGLSAQDGETEFSAAPFAGAPRMKLKALESALKATYSGKIGCEFEYIEDLDVREWLAERVESTQNSWSLDAETKVFIYEELLRAEQLESFIDTKFRGAKRFSLEGGESLIPMLSLILEEGAKGGVEEVVFGMAHRGRLNVLVNTMGKPASQLFAEFQDNYPEEMKGRSDVKYHLGYDNIRKTRQGHDVAISMTFNPSHLEFIDPVVQGKVRGIQDRLEAAGQDGRKKVMAVLMHGDAAMAGQGVVAETLNMSELRGYSTGGTIHIVTNNQIGFTTNPSDSRSARYSTEVAKMIQAPIIHVNGEDPEAVAQVSRLAAEFRQRFQRDIVIDLICYRRYGHNESDEPAFTQPLMYEVIQSRKPVHVAYGEKIIAEGATTQAALDAFIQANRDALEEDLLKAPSELEEIQKPLTGRWANYRGGAIDPQATPDTAISAEDFETVIQALVTSPEGFNVNRKVVRLLGRREKALEGNAPIDWGLGELLAYGSLLLDKAPVRLTGQDVVRGTFSHRHAGLFDEKTGECYIGLQNMREDQGAFSIYNSLLSETAVLGFEYGYGLEVPEGLTMWEAQFGDFANGAQVIIDQFITSGEMKWNRLSALALLLPHGFEGQGPEHSSARLERFLQLAAEDNMYVTNLTTPAQIFHALRRQVVDPLRKPLVVMSPKSLLRHRRAVSYRADFETGQFQRVIGEQLLEDLGQVRRAILCSGKVYYDLLERREALGDTHTALIRIEQLYPFPEAQVLEALGALRGGEALDEVLWVQEEPRNMGAFHYLFPILLDVLGREVTEKLKWVSRPATASPATGSGGAHALEQEELLKQAFESL